MVSVIGSLLVVSFFKFSLCEISSSLYALRQPNAFVLVSGKGELISSHREDNLQKCATLCTKTEGCNAFNNIASNPPDHTCYLVKIENPASCRRLRPCDSVSCSYPGLLGSDFYYKERHNGLELNNRRIKEVSDGDAIDCNDASNTLCHQFATKLLYTLPGNYAKVETVYCDWNKELVLLHSGREVIKADQEISTCPPESVITGVQILLDGFKIICTPVSGMKIGACTTRTMGIKGEISCENLGDGFYAITALGLITDDSPVTVKCCLLQ